MQYRWFLVIACVIISAYYSGVVFLGFTAIFEPLVEEFGWSYAQISIVASLRGAESGLVVPVAGILINRYGPRAVIGSGAMIAGIGLVALSRVDSLLTFYICFIVMACGVSTATTGLLMAVVSGWFKVKRGLATGITASGVAVGGLILPLVTYLIDGIGWRAAMFYLGIGIWLIPLPLALSLRPSPPAIGGSMTGEKISTLAARKILPLPPKELDAREALKSNIFWAIFLCYMCLFFPIGAALTHIMPFLSSVGVDRTTGSLIASALPIMTIVGRIGFGWLGDRVGNKEMTITAMTLTTLGSFLASFIAGGNLWIIVPFVFLFGVGWGGAVPMLNAMLCDCFGSRYIASLYGFAGIGVMLGIVFGAPLAGWIYDRTSSYSMAWFLLAVISGTGAILFFKFVNSPGESPVTRPLIT